MPFETNPLNSLAVGQSCDLRYLVGDMRCHLKNAQGVESTRHTQGQGSGKRSAYQAARAASDDGSARKVVSHSRNPFSQAMNCAEEVKCRSHGNVRGLSGAAPASSG
jgi:hypothetical protein